MNWRLLSGCDARYFRCLCQLLLSLQRFGEHERHAVRLYDLGLRPEQETFLRRRFGWAELTRYQAPTPHLASLSNYGWKPTILAAEARRDPRPLLWLDSACRLLDRLDPVWRHVSEAGVWCPHGGGAALREITAAPLFERLHISAEEAQVRIRAGGVCAFAPTHERARQLLESWAAAAADPQLLLPKGYDQTLLTLLLARSGLDPSQDELDISSSRPTPWLASRNKVPNGLPLWLDPLARLYFWTYRTADVWLLRRRRKS